MARKTLPSYDDLQHARLRVLHIKAIADLVGHARRDELYRDTIPAAMDAIITEIDKIEDLIETVDSATHLEVIRG